MKNGMAELGIKSLIFLPGTVEPHHGPRGISFEGFSVDEKGKKHYLDATVAYAQASLRCIGHLKRFGNFSSSFIHPESINIMNICTCTCTIPIRPNILTTLPAYNKYQVYLLLSAPVHRAHGRSSCI